MKHPQSLKPAQKTIAALLAVGAQPREIAEKLGVSVSYINVLLKGDLFQFEIDQQRRKLVGERIEEYSKLVSEQLTPNLKTLIEIRDNPESPPQARLRAVELINEALIPKAKPQKAPEARVSIRLTPEQEAAINVAAREDEPEPGNRS